MKELSVEEKAQRYDEALERAKCVIEQNPLMEYLKKGIEYIFHELKEDEDERIRKALIELVRMVDKNPIHQIFGYGDIKYSDMIAWLEKQGEQKPNDKVVPKFKIGDYVKNVNDKREPIYEIVYMDKECYICEYRGKENMGDKVVMHFAFDNPYLRLVEQKSVDKVEPKFHEGEWITIKQ